MLCSREIFKFLVRKDVRKILKRKDSDAGERGKALEDLRASLFNKFYSVDSAKHQRTCGPVAALTFNFMVAVASPPTISTSLSLFTLGIVMSLSTGFANVSLKYNSVGLYQMAKIAVTPSIVLAEFVWYQKRVTFSKVIALTVVSIGVAIATVTDLQFSLFGACVAMAWIIPSAINKILWSNLQQEDNWTALSLMWKTTPITLLFLVSMIPFLDPRVCSPSIGASTIHRQSSYQLFSASCFSGRELCTWGNLCYLPRGSRTIQNLCSASRKLLPLQFESRHNQYVWSVYSYRRHVPFHIPQLKC
ncbi:nucleotide-sugar uncharacterized transporter 1-like isoform X3 [Hibiscus syriacus]|uniref:nucleotide-sugar uncharacterized transporter 1-like isoform X3 n=1 Tax=Hibiscus syriacus TaxID=106335 RepID=UPI001920B532|nr:nucleotide-sugar uncharacterized transporter 1-like isoform X3 [Hibiscus syriacus]